MGEKSDTSWDISIISRAYSVLPGHGWFSFLHSEVAAKSAVALDSSLERKQNDALALAAAAKWL